MATHLEEAFMPDIRMRKDEGEPRDGWRFNANDITPGVIYEANGVKVTAFEVDHGNVKPAYGYRVDYRGHSVVLSGDTRFSENLIKFATGADLLVHEVLMAKAGLLTEAITRTLSIHTSPPEAGRVFSTAKPRLAVYSHINTQTAGDFWAEPADYIAATRETYNGPLELGEDLMTINVGEAVIVERPKK